MTIYIALIRGINVGGHNKVPMAELRTAYEGIGLNRVKTYIQSGNVVFESEENAETLRPKLEKALADRFGLSANVVVRTAEQWERVLANCPFDASALKDKESIQIAALTEPPSRKAMDALEANRGESENYAVAGSDIYFLFRPSVLESKLAKCLPKLGDTATMRNWNTANRIAEMARDMAGPEGSPGN